MLMVSDCTFLYNGIFIKIAMLSITEMQAKRLQLDGGDRSERSERKRKSRFGDEDDIIPEKTLIPMVIIVFFVTDLNPS